MIINLHLQAGNRLLSRKKTKKPDYNTITFLLLILQKTFRPGDNDMHTKDAKDIPFQDGPYKFRGLPGLIIKIKDQTHSHSFELKGIKNRTADFKYPEESSYKSFISISHAKYTQLYRSFLETLQPDGQILPATR